MKDHNYLSVVTSSWKKIYKAKIRTNSPELHSETSRWSIPESTSTEMVFHLCESMRVEDENHFLLECPAYTHIRSEFHSICYYTNLYNLLTCQNYSELEKLIGKLLST